MNATRRMVSDTAPPPPGWATRGMRFSLGLHAVLLLLVIFGLPAFFDAKVEPEPVVISVEILPVTGITNIKPASRETALEVEQPKEAPKPVEDAKKPPPPKPVPPTTSAAEPEHSERALVMPDAPKEEKKPEEKKPEPKEEKKPEERKKPEEKKKKEDSLDAILKSVADAAKKEAPEAPPNPKPAEKQAAPAAEKSDKPNNSTKYDANLPMSMSEKDAIVSQLQKCWNMPAGARDAQDLAVLLKVRLNQDGSLISVALADNQMRYTSDNFFRAAAESAIRAVKRCTPILGLPTDKYGSWQELDVNFDPKNMLF